MCCVPSVVRGALVAISDDDAFDGALRGPASTNKALSVPRESENRLFRSDARCLKVVFN